MNKILIVDDSKIDQLIIKEVLKEYELLSAYDGFEALEVLKENDDIDVVILDLNMPRMNGFEVLEALSVHLERQDFSVVILTNYEEIENEIKGLELGAVDYIRKPLNSESLHKRIEIHLNLLKAKNEIRNHNRLLEEKVRIRTEELEFSRDVTVNALIGLLEVRDIESSNHTKRTQHMMFALSQHLSLREKYKDILTNDKIQLLFKAAPLHDIGKVGIPDKILLKPGKLTEEEFNIMKDHVQYGVNALMSEYQGKDLGDFMQTVVRLIGGHHEKFDGTGYPKGLSGEEIPLEGRLMAVIDVYDALTSKRVYKEAFAHSISKDILLTDRGKHFDPEIVDAFLEIEDVILQILEKYGTVKSGGRFEI